MARDGRRPSAQRVDPAEVRIVTPVDVERLLASAIEHDDTGVMIACYVALGREYPRDLECREPEACAYYAWRGETWARGELERGVSAPGDRRSW